MMIKRAYYRVLSCCLAVCLLSPANALALAPLHNGSIVSLMGKEANPFANPQELRRLILEKVRIRLLERFNGKSFVFMFPTKFCPVGCKHCYFASPTFLGRRRRTKKDTFTEEGITKFLKFVKDAKTEHLFISGGGEPFTVVKQVLRIVKEAEADFVNLVTNGMWAKSYKNAEKTIDKVYQAAAENKSKPRVSIRVSLDEFHVQKIPLQNTLNIIEVYRKKYAAQKRDFALYIHTFFTDRTVDNMLKGLPVKQQIKKSESRTEVILEDGFSFEIERSELVYPDEKVDLNNQAILERNVAIFDKRSYRKRFRDGKIISSVYQDRAGNKGIDFLVNYNGIVEPWGASSYDNPSDIYKENFAQIKDRILADVVSLSLAEKGILYMDSILNELNEIGKKAVTRAKAVNITDYYTRLALEEEKTRLYFVIRVMQDYLKEKRISAKDLPEEIRLLVLLDKQDLIRLYNDSAYTIVDQTLKEFENNPQASPAKLVYLYELVQKGHFNVSLETMEETIKKTELLSAKQKADFFVQTKIQHPALDSLIAAHLNNPTVVKVKKLVAWIDREFRYQISNNFAEIDDILISYKGIMACFEPIIEKIISGRIDPAKQIAVSLKDKDKKLGNDGQEVSAGIFTGSFSPLHWGHFYNCLRALASSKTDFDTILFTPIIEDIQNITLTGKKKKKLLPEKVREEMILPAMQAFEESGLIRYCPLSLESPVENNREQILHNLLLLNRNIKLSLGFIWGKYVIRDTETMKKVHQWIKKLLNRYNIEPTYLLVGRKIRGEKLEVALESFERLTEKGLRISVIKDSLETEVSSTNILKGKSILMPAKSLELFRLYRNKHLNKLKALYFAQAQKYIVFDEAEKAKIKLSNSLFETRLREFIAQYLKGRFFSFMNHGSTGRMTNIKDEEGYDVDFLLYADNEDLEKITRDPQFLKGLEKVIHSVFKELGLPEEELKLKRLNRMDGFLYYIGSEDKQEGNRIIEITLLNKQYQPVNYARFLNGQKEQIINKWGSLAWEDTLEDIRLMKFIIKYFLEAYKYYEGGIDGIGIEQLIIQSGKVSNKGTIIAEKGSFDSAIKLIYDYGYDEVKQQVVPIDEVVEKIKIYNSDGKNKLTFSKEAWERLVRFAVSYVKNSRATGLYFESKYVNPLILYSIFSVAA